MQIYVLLDQLKELLQEGNFNVHRFMSVILKSTSRTDQELIRSMKPVK